jgi:hypothetical protein
LPRVASGTVLFAITKPFTTGTELTDAKVAITVRRGELGTTTAKSRVQTATHERPHEIGWQPGVAAANALIPQE